MRVISSLRALPLARMVLVVLAGLVVAAVVARLAGGLDAEVFALDAMAATLAVLVGVSVGSSWLLGLVFRSHPSVDSALITALLLWFLYWPSADLAVLAWFAVIAAVAQASKYVIAWRRRHLVNPAAAGVIISNLVAYYAGIEQMPLASWWVASSVMLWPVIIGALLVVWRTGRPAIFWVFVLVAGTWTVRPMMDFGFSLWEAIEFAFASTPLVFFAAFMLTEPLTLPSRRRWQYVAAVLAALVFTLPLTAATVADVVLPLPWSEIMYESALVVTGIVAFLAGQTGRRIQLVSRRDLGADAVEYRFALPRPLRFVPGQYVEIDIPHAHADRRGHRRVLSPASVPGGDLVVATRHPEPGSSWKRALIALQPGDAARVTAVHGDFVWPRKGPILLVGAGIGVTPFLGQLAAEPDRDVVVILGERPEGQPYATELAATGVRLVRAPADDITADFIADHVPDLKARTALVSGRPEFVAPVAVGLHRRVKKVLTDHFWGY